MTAFPEGYKWFSLKIPLLNKKPFNVLDVASGSFSTLAYLHDSGLADVEAVDPLAEEYVKMIRDYGLQCPVMLKAFSAERLSNYYGANFLT